MGENGRRVFFFHTLRKARNDQPTRSFERVWIAHRSEISMQAGSIIQMRTPHRGTAIGERTFHGDGVDSLCRMYRTVLSPPTPRRALPPTCHQQRNPRGE